MFGYFPDLGDTGWLDTQHAEPKPKTVAKSIVEARGPDAESAMETWRQRAERETGKPHKWVEVGDAWQLQEGQAVPDRVIVKKF